MKNYPKPPLIEMMKSLYYLYSIELIQWPVVEFDLENAYDVYKVEINGNEMIAYEHSNKLRGKTITTIPI
jgi:hypothetical protein